MSPDSGSGIAPRLNVLHERQIGLLHAGAVRVLESTGVEVRHEVALDLLKRAGGRVDGSRAFIPVRLVDRALETAPLRITLWDREGNAVMPLDGGRTYFGGSSDNPEILDPYLRQRRPLNREDVVLATRLCDALPNVDFVMSGGLVSDVDPQVADRVAFKEMVLNTTKPLMFCCSGRSSLDDIVEMAAAVADGLDALTARPFVCHYSEPVSPLTHSTDAVDKLIRCSELGLPCVYIPMPMAGATAPATGAGTLVVNMAETLSGLVISQLAREGAPFIFGGIPGILDMKTTVFPYAAPEMWLWSAALADAGRFYGLPVFSTGGCSDSKWFDQQAAAEAAMSCLMGALSGATFVHDLGFLDRAVLLSLELMVFEDEVIGAIRSVMNGVEVGERTMALDLVQRVGPGGHFVGERHTRENYRSFWSPSLFDRGRDWAGSGPDDLFEKLNARVKRILENHRARPLADDVVGLLDAMESRWK